MAITSEQAKAELRRRQAIAELQRRQSTQDIKSATGGISVGPAAKPTFAEFEQQQAQKEWLRKMIESGRIKPEPRTFGQRFRADLPQMGGGAAGGLAGAKLGSRFGPWGALAGGVAGAGIGGMGGKGYQQLYRMDRGEAMTLPQILKEQGVAGLQEAGSELAGRGIAGLGGKVLRPLKSKLIPSTPRLGKKLVDAGTRIPAENIAELTPYAQKLLGKKKIFLTAAQATESRGMDFVESATESSLFGGNRIFQVKKILQPKAYKQVVRELSDTFWNQAERKLSPEEVGQLFVDTVTGKRGVQRRLERIAYGQVDQMIGDVRVDMRPVKKQALRLLKEAEKSKGLGSASGIKRVATRVSKWDDTTETFMDAHAMRSNLLEEVRKLESLLNTKLPKVKRAADILAKHTDRAMAKAARGQSEQAYLAWRAADKLVKGGRKTFNNEAVQSTLKLAKKRPELVAKSLFVPHGSQRLAQVKKVVTPETYDSLLASFMDQTMDKASTADGILLGKNFKKAINQLGPEMHARMFKSGEHLQSVMDVANLGEILQSPTGGGGGMLVQLTQAGGIIDLAIGLPTGQAPKKGTALILVGPALMGRLLSTEGGAKWLSEGIGPTGARHAPTQVLRLLRSAYAAQQSQQQQQQQQMPGRELQGFGGRGY